MIADKEQGGKVMSNFMLPLLFIIVGAAVIFIVRAYYNDYALHETTTWENFAITAALLVSAIVLLLWLLNLMSPTQGGK